MILVRVASHWWWSAVRDRFQEAVARGCWPATVMMGTRNDGTGSYTTPTEWKMWNQTKLSQSQLERLTAERLVAESKRLQDDVGNRVTSTRREVSSSAFLENNIL